MFRRYTYRERPISKNQWSNQEIFKIIIVYVSLEFLDLYRISFFSIETLSIVANITVFVLRSTLFNEFSISINRFERRMLNLTLVWMFRIFEFDKLLSVISSSKIWLFAFELSTMFRAVSFRISSSIRTFLLIIFNFFIASIEFSDVMFSISWISIYFVNEFSAFLILNRFNRLFV